MTFCKNTHQTRMATLPKRQKPLFLALNCRTRVAGTTNIQSQSYGLTLLSKQFLMKNDSLAISLKQHQTDRRLVS